MSATDNAGHEASDGDRLGPLQVFQLEFEILWPKLSDKDLFSRDVSCNHALA
jgi:hypothetical protein